MIYIIAYINLQCTEKINKKKTNRKTINKFINKNQIFSYNKKKLNENDEN